MNYEDNTLPAYRIDVETLLIMLGSRRSGLTASEIEAAKAKYGENRLISRKKISPVFVFFRQFLSPLVYVLLAAALVKFIIGGYLDAIVILFVLLLMGLIGFFQESRAEAAMEALQQNTAPQARVRRGDEILMIQAADVVPGDILILETGDRIPAGPPHQRSREIL